MPSISKPTEDAVTLTHSESFRFTLFELGGAVGDLGTLLPLTVALITINHMNATGVFLVVGLAYVVAGLVYRLPVPVQPLKAVAAIAIATGIPASVVSASGMVMAAFLLVLAATGAINLIARLFTKAFIRGLQLGVGMLLVKTGWSLMNRQEVVSGKEGGLLTVSNFSMPVGLVMALGLGIVFILFLRSKKIPASLVLLLVGGLVGVFWGSLLELSGLRFGLSLPQVTVPSVGDLSSALVLLVIPQIPLTLGNAVFATEDTARAYFGHRAKRITPKALLATMGVANLGAGLLGGMPICHGAGGLTAHFRLGARTGGACLMMGIPLLLLAVLFDGNILPILSLIPYPALGVLVVFSGIQHCLLAQDVRGKEEALVAFMIGIVGLVTVNLAIGLASGMGLQMVLRAKSRNGNLHFRAHPGKQAHL